ncbi:MAG: hypothetical protein ACXWWQ_01635 [Candidatus Limnocylindria bacterium]
MPTSVNAASVPGWSLTATPTTVTVGVVTTVAMRLTDTDGSGDIGCMRLSIPATFAVVGAVVTGTSADGPWTVTTSGAGPTAIRVFNPGGDGKLEGGDWVDVQLSVRGQQPGMSAWTANVVQGDDCSGDTFLDPISLAMTVVSAPSPTPPPTPRPTPTPAPTAEPPTPTPSAGAPRPAPSAPAGGSDSSPVPAGAQPAATPDPPASSSPSASSLPDQGAEGPPLTDEDTPPDVSLPGVAPDRVPGGADGPSPVGDVSFGVPLIDSADVGLATGFELLGHRGDGYTWFVPGLVVAVPGLLLVILVMLNVLVGAAWVPNVGRLLGPAPPDHSTDQNLWWATGRSIDDGRI